jgi:zinc D-Ala-D-Ala carboxypeptidase
LRRYVLTSVLIGSTIFLSACQPVDWAVKEWKDLFHDPKRESQQLEDGQGGEQSAKQDPPEQTEETDRPEVEKPIEKELPWLGETVAVTGNGKPIVQNLDDILIVVNKQRNLPPEYEPQDLVIPDIPFPFKEDLPKKKLRKEAADAIKALFDESENQGLELLAQSGYRSYDTQVSIFAYNENQYGEARANQVSAQPGQSEHQTGLAIDVTSPKVEYQLVEEFGETREGKWVADNAHKYGFIVRYLKGKEEITGYQYEPWHLRYVGIDHAQEIHKRGITLEEYLQKP